MKRKLVSYLVLSIVAARFSPTATGHTADVSPDTLLNVPVDSTAPVQAPAAAADSVSAVTALEARKAKKRKIEPITPYAMPVSWTASNPDWHRLWLNTAALSTAFVGTLLVLECLPEDATSWNRAELRDVPLLKRWKQHVIEKGVEWDHDKFYFNYILHPYAGGAYFMAARSCGFNFWQSMLYCSLVSNVGWEYGIEAFMERPSAQDLFITPVVGSLVGEGFYRAKRRIVDNGYTLCGSRLLGCFVAFLVDPVNEFMGYLTRNNPARKLAKSRRLPGAGVSLYPSVCRGYRGVGLVACF